jgi:putative N6-adenine-specific DNA methylase
MDEPQAYLAGSDLDPRTIEMAAASITAAGLEDFIKLSVPRCERRRGPVGPFVAGPACGERIGEEAEMDALYKT